MIVNALSHIPTVGTKHYWESGNYFERQNIRKNQEIYYRPRLGPVPFSGQSCKVNLYRS